MSFATFHPLAPLSDFVEKIWDWDAPAPAHRFDRMLPVANAGLIINLAENQTRVYDDAPGLACRKFSGTALDAPRSKSFVIDSAEQTKVMGVVFRCGAAAPFFRERMDTIINDHIDLDDFSGLRSRDLRERLLEARSSTTRIALLQAWLLAACRNLAIPDWLVHATQALQRVPCLGSVAHVAKSSGMSPRLFSDLFREHVGMSPKRYARLQRFRAVVEGVHRNETVEWTRVAADCGFYDQPHLVREFRDFSGMTPSAYLAARGEYVNHVPLTDI